MHSPTAKPEPFQFRLLTLFFATAFVGAYIALVNAGANVDSADGMYYEKKSYEPRDTVIMVYGLLSVVFGAATIVSLIAPKRIGKDNSSEDSRTNDRYSHTSP